MGGDNIKSANNIKCFVYRTPVPVGIYVVPDHQSPHIII